MDRDRDQHLVEVRLGRGGTGAEVHGLDATPALVEYARRRVPGAAEFVVGDISALPFAESRV